MSIAKSQRHLPTRVATTTHPCLFGDVIADYLHSERDKERAGHVRLTNSRVWNSMAGYCARRIGYMITGEEGEPPDAESLWSFAMGDRAHEIVQGAFVAYYGDRAEIEVSVDNGERSSRLDVLLRFADPEPFDIDGVTYLCRVVSVELKSTGGYSWSLQVKEEGPKPSAYLQGAMNALDVEADLMVIGYLSLDRQNATAKRLYGTSRGPLDAVWATWAYPRSVYEPDARKEIHRLAAILALVDGGEMPPRHVPELPRGARIVDPSSGRWEVRATRIVEGQPIPETWMVTDSGSYWGCNYCPHQARCVTDAAAENEAAATAREQQELAEMRAADEARDGA